jgi:hypothetical protein
VCTGGVCESTCGDGVCDVNCETCANCASDCGCNDGVDCTNDTCQAGQCVFAPNNAKCDDGQFCNGAEVCTSGMGCIPGNPPCPGSPTACDEDADECDEELIPIPTVSEWGLVVFALLLLVMGKISFARRAAA